VDDVLLVNNCGDVTESTIANLAVKLDGRWWTPSLDSGLLPGVGRQAALADGRLLECRIGVEDLAIAEELALVSDARGWRKAILVKEA
jgi:para-aminobenzoate synthetase/4-amino-4-deoxychorismate lyase